MDLSRHLSHPASNFLTICFKEVKKELLHKIQLMPIHQGLMLFCRYPSKMAKNCLGKYLLLILLVIREELIIWIWENKQELMGLKLISLYFLLNNASGHWIKEKDTLLSEDQSLPWCLRTLLLDFAELS